MQSSITMTAPARCCVSSTRCIGQARLLPGPQQIHQRSVLTRAYQPGSSGGREQQPVDWDSAWSSFQRDMRSQVDSNVTTQTAFRPVALPRNGDMQQQIRRQEQVMLNIWTSSAFQSAGPVAVVVLFLAMALVAGPPPSDGRCTLPWC